MTMSAGAIATDPLVLNPARVPVPPTLGVVAGVVAGIAAGGFVRAPAVVGIVAWAKAT
jgi:hypothetical protein